MVISSPDELFSVVVASLVEAEAVDDADSVEVSFSAVVVEVSLEDPHPAKSPTAVADARINDNARFFITFPSLG